MGGHTSADTTNEGVADNCVFGVFNVEHLQHQTDNLLFKFFTRQAGWAFPRDFGLQCEIQGLAYC